MGQPPIIAADAGSGVEALPLLASRLSAPPGPATLVERPRLYRALDAAVRGPVTLIRAPAGWGKTVLVSSWARSRPRVGWIAGHPDDDPPAYLHAALAPLVGRLDTEPLPPPPAAPDAGYWCRLADRLAHLPEPLVLVVDDADAVTDPATLAGMSFLARHAAARLRLVLAARTDPALPVARWRVTGELTDLGPAELRFTEAETALLLGRHGAPTTTAAQVWRRCEGWAAGIRLTATGSGSRAADPVAAVADYLAAELLAEVPAAAREALYAAAVTPTASVAMIDAMVGDRDGEPEGLLLAAERADGFVVPLGGDPPAYRLHHLVGEALRAQLHRHRPERARELHRRAATWLAHHDRGPDALRQGLTAGDPALLARLGAERRGELLAELAAVVPGLSDERQRAWGYATLAGYEQQRGRLRRAAAAARAAADAADRAGADVAAADAWGRLALVQVAAGELSEALVTARRALDRGRPAGYAYLAVARVAWERDRLPGAQAALALADRAARTGAPGADPAGPDPVLAAWVAVTAARLRLGRDELPAARRELERARSALAGLPWCRRLAQEAAVIDAEVCLAEGDLTGARAALDGQPGEPPVACALAGIELRGHDPVGAARLLPAGADVDRLPLPDRLAVGWLTAAAAARRGDRAVAGRELERVLALAEPEGFRRLLRRPDPAVRELLTDRLDAGAGHRPILADLVEAAPAAASPAPGPAEPLTERELLLLRYLQGVLSNAEIAAELHLSVNTVKTHLRNVYRKLGTTRRREAVRRARQWRLL